MFSLFVFLVLFLPFAISSPALVPRAATSALSTSNVDSTFLRPALFSRIAYCSPGVVKSLTCGAPCDAVPGVQVTQSGGDAALIPRYFIAIDPTMKSVVVAHQGTNTGNPLSDLNDLNFDLVGLDAQTFPNQASGVQVHEGFQETFLRTSSDVLAGVKQALATSQFTNVAVTGHSLGAAIATFDAIMLKQNLSPSVTVSTVVFGLPRSGNQAWANFVDAQLGANFKFMTNQQDPVPDLPPKFLRFVHPNGEVHINTVNAAGDAVNVVACAGQENTACSAGNNPFQVSIQNHLGPYLHNVAFGGAACPL